MDPKACFEEIVYHFARRDWEETLEHSTALIQWLEKGGFCPLGSNMPEYRRDVLGFARMASRIARSALGK